MTDVATRNTERFIQCPFCAQKYSVDFECSYCENSYGWLVDEFMEIDNQQNIDTLELGLSNKIAA